MGDETFEDDVKTEALNEINDEVDILIRREEVEVGRISKILFRHPSTFDEL